MADLFISYGRKDDTSFVKRLYGNLTALGFDVWLDKERMESRGRTFLQEIRDAGKEVKRLILIVGPKAARSDYVNAEWSYALENCTAVVPILRLGDYSLVPSPLSKIHCIDFRETRSYSQAFSELTRILSKPVTLGELHGVDRLPNHFVPRPEELDSLREVVLADVIRPTIITAAKRATTLQGMGGVGKSVLAAAFAQSCETRHSLKDGVAWVKLHGDDPDLTAGLRSVGEAFGDAPSKYFDLESAKKNLADVLRDKVCLVVLDDVWKHHDAKVFENALGPRCRLLITTRDAGLVVSLKAQEHRVDILTDAAALSLLANWSEKPVESLPSEALTVARECGNLPLALAQCGATVSSGTPWADVVSALREAKLGFVAQEEIDGYQYRDVFAAIKVSVDYLAKSQSTAVQHYLELAVFPAEWIPEAAVAALWRHTHPSRTDFDERDARMLVTTLHNKALIHRLDGDAPGRRILLHDLQRDYIRTTQGPQRLRELHEQVLQSYGYQVQPHLGPDDGYYFQRLPLHLVEAGRADELRGLLLDFDWIQAKLNATNIATLLADYDLLPADVDLTVLRESMRFSAHIIAQDKTQLAGQLLGRLAAHQRPGIRKVIEQAARWKGASWLRPLAQSLASPDDSLLRAVQGYTLTVVAVALTTNGTKAVAGSGSGALETLDLKRGTKQLLNAPGNEISAVAITSNAKYAIASCGEGILKVWHLKGHAKLRLLEGKFGRVSAVALTPDGRRAASGSADGTLRIWDLKNLTELHNTNRAGSVTALALSADAKLALSGSDKGTLKVWSADTGGELHGWDGHGSRITTIAISEDGKFAISGSGDGMLKIWDLRTFALKRTLVGHKGWVRSVALTRDGQRAVSGADDITVKIWNLKSRSAPLTLLGHNGSVSVVALSDDGKFAISASGDETYIVWDLKTGNQVRTLPGHTEWIRAATITKDGRHAVTGADDGKLTIWDMQTHEKVLVTATGHSAWVNTVTVTANGRYAVSGADDNRLKVWDLENGRELATWEGHTNGVTCVAITPDGSRAISGSWDERVRLWDFKTGRSQLTRTHHKGWIRSVAIAPNGRYAASASYDNTLKLWDLESRKAIHTFVGHKTWATGVTFTPDGKRLVSSSADETVKVWDIRSGKVLRTLKGHTGFVTMVTVTPDGSRAISTSEDRTVKLWDLKTGEALATFTAEGELRACAVAPDGITMVASDTLGRVHFLRLEAP
jgi:WD40 repeat protein